MLVVETVSTTGSTRLIDPELADGIIKSAETTGYTITRKWGRTGFSVSITRPWQRLAMLTYFTPWGD